MSRVRMMMLLGGLTALFGGFGLALAGPRGAMAALALAAGLNIFTWWHADRIVLKLHDAREVDARCCPELVCLVSALAARAGLPCPRVFVIESAHPNAFATGRDPDHAAVALTTGLLGLLDRAEIAAVVAHELGHIRNRDTLVMTMTATIAGAIGLLAHAGIIFGGRARGPLALLLGVLVAPFAALIVQCAISRTREYAADRAGAEISRNPRALAAALAKLGHEAARVPSRQVHRRPALAALYIVPGGRDGLFATHPPTARRIAALEELAGGVRSRATRPRARRPSALDPLGQ